MEGLFYDVAQPIYSLTQLYFIFKFGNVIVNKNRWLARLESYRKLCRYFGVTRFTFAHCMGSSMSLWMFTLYSETLDAIVQKYFPKEIDDSGDSCDDYDDHRMNHFPMAFLRTINASMAATSGGLENKSTSNMTTYAGDYLWTACSQDGSIGDSMRCVVSRN